MNARAGPDVLQPAHARRATDVALRPASAARSATARRWLRACLLLLAAHVAFAFARVPGKVYGKRAAEIAAYETRGPARYLLGNAGLGGAEVVEWLRAHVPPEAVVLWRGEADGTFEVLAGLLAPRLLVADTALAPGATVHRVVPDGDERPLARATLPDGRSGVLVVCARADDLALEVR